MKVVVGIIVVFFLSVFSLSPDVKSSDLSAETDSPAVLNNSAVLISKSQISNLKQTNTPDRIAGLPGRTEGDFSAALIVKPRILADDAILLVQPGLVPADLSAPDTLRGWDLSWKASLHGSQATYTNWSRGGLNSLNLSSSSIIELLYRRDKFIYELSLRNRYGQARIEEGVRKTDDQILVRNRFLYDINRGGGNYKFFGNLNFETQFTQGYNYDAGEDGENILISDFMSPGYLSQSAGLAYYTDEDALSLEAGLGLKQTIMQDTTLSTRYGLDEGRMFKSEAGFTFGLNFESEIMENVEYEGYIETFTNMLHHFRRTHVFLSSQVVGKVNSHIDVKFRFDMIYDDSYSTQLQINQSFAAGVSVNIK